MSEAQRGAVFTLKARTDESVGREFAAIGERAAQLQAMLGNFELGGLDVGEFETTVDREHARLDALHQRAMSPVNLTPIATSQIATQQPTGARSLPSPAGADTALEKVVAQHEAAEAKMDAATTTGAARRAAANGHAAKVEAQQEAALTQKVDAENEKQADAERQAADKRAAAEAKAVDQRIAGWDKETAAHARDEDRKLAAANKTRAAFVAGGGEAVEQDQQTHESAARKVEELNSRLRASLAEVGNSAAEVARGFVEMGLVSEEDFNKIKDSILSIQEAMDRISGGIKFWKSITEAAKLYHERLELIAKAEELAVAAHGGGKAVEAAGHAAGAGVRGPGAAGLLGIAASPLAVTLASAGAAVLGVLSAAKVISESLREVKGPVDQFGFSLTSLSHKIVETEVSILSSAKELTTGLLGKTVGKVVFNASILGHLDKLPELFGGKSFSEAHEAEAKEKEARQKELDIRQKFIQGLLEVNQKESEAREKRIAAAARYNAVANSVSPLASPEEQVAAKRRALEADRESVESERGGVNERFKQAAEVSQREGQESPVFQQAVREREQFEERVEALRERELQIAQEERQVSIDGARKKLQLMADQIQKQRSLIEMLNDEAKTAQEKEEDALVRLGSMTQGESQRLGNVKQKLTGGQELSRKQQEFAEQYGDEETKELLRRQRLQRGLERQKQLAGRGVNVVNQEHQAFESATSRAREANEEHDEMSGRYEREHSAAEAANRGTKFSVNMNNQVEAKVTGDTEMEAKVKAAMLAAAKEHLKSQEERIQGWIQEAFEQAKEASKKASDRTTQKRNQTKAAGA
jgi:hypothetical protein